VQDLVVNTILIFDLQMINKFVNNNYKRKGFGMQRFENDLSWVSTQLVEVFTQTLGVLAESSDLLAWSLEKLVQSTDVLS
jgi:hypothetical protein